MVWVAARKWTIGWCVLVVIQAALPVITIVLTRATIDHLTTFFTKQSAWNDSGLWFLSLAIVVAWLAGQAAASVMSIVRTNQTELVKDYLADKIHSQAASLDIEFYDNPLMFDLMHRVRNETQQPVLLLEHGGLIVQNLITILGLSVILASYSLWLTLILLASIVPGLFFVSGFIRRELRWKVENTPKERRQSYYDVLLTERSSAPEMRMFDLCGHLRKKYQLLRKEFRQGRLALAIKGLKTELAAGLAGWAGITSGMGWMFVQTLRKNAKLGDLVLCFQTFQQGQAMIRSLVESASKIYLSLIYLEQLFTLLDMKHRGTIPGESIAMPVPLTEGIRFELVHFRYPNSDRNILNGLSFTVKAGELTTLVGLNGAGKSTIIKLLCRFYDPTAGSIMIDGIDLRQFAENDVRRSVSVLFQDFMFYHTTVAENIVMGDVTAADDHVRTRRAAMGACADEVIARLSDGYDTEIGWFFGGQNLSYGQWQRLALTRTLFKESPIILLDEPTSAMDPWTETLWLKRIRKWSAGHTVIIITHRFTTAMHADRVVLVQEGRVTEQGTHEQLLALNGLYAENWRTQYKEMTTT
ncbi:MAG: ABC transporter ATP-binding protein [Nitrospirae bacterium]|nr:ABC transporter ATP-binding protein [Nitrospirota bacterium]